MKIEFSTKNIEKSFYEKCILHFIYQHYEYSKDNQQKFIDQDKWNIYIKPLDNFSWGFYDNYRKDELSSNMAHGVTGMNEVICYIHDIKNDFYTLQNLSVIGHELAHMILKVYYPNFITRKRHDDFYTKKGTQRQLYSSEVHDRLTEGRTRKVTIKQSLFKKFSFYAVDISDLTV